MTLTSLRPLVYFSQFFRPYLSSFFLPLVLFSLLLEKKLPLSAQRGNKQLTALFHQIIIYIKNNKRKLFQYGRHPSSEQLGYNLTVAALAIITTLHSGLSASTKEPSRCNTTTTIINDRVRTEVAPLHDDGLVGGRILLRQPRNVRHFSRPTLCCSFRGG